MYLRTRHVFLGLCSLALASAPAFADGCITQSHGLSFYSQSQDVNQATNAVLGDCRASAMTDNNECSQNLRCDAYEANPYPSGQVSCYTASKNIGFQMTGSENELNATLNALLNLCRANPVTDNDQCAQGFVCADSYSAQLPYPTGEIVCTTSSRNISFSQQGRASDIDTVSEGVLNQCRSNPQTDNDECANSLMCLDVNFPNQNGGNPNPGDNDQDHDGYGITCHTESHSIDFSAHGSQDQVNQLTTQVLNQCQANPVTDNDECSSNLRCE